MTNEETTTIIHLLKMEVKSLRAVLSEWEEDKNCYNQMILADDIRRLLENFE